MFLSIAFDANMKELGMDLKGREIMKNLRKKKQNSGL
jgi:hypothetical protein